MATTYLTPWGTPGAAIGVYDVFASGGDVTAPILSSVTVAETFAFGTYLSAATDSQGEGTAYAIISTSATPPSVAQIQAGNDSSGSAAIAAVSWNDAAGSLNSPELAGLAHNTTYYGYIQQEDDAANDSLVYETGSFTTLNAAVSAASTGETTGNGYINPRWNTGKVWWVVTQSATTPSIAQIQAGQDHTGSAADDDGSESATFPWDLTIGATGLTLGNTYYFHFQYEAAGTEDSAPITSNSFTTAAASSDDFTTRLRDGTYRRRAGGIL